MQCGLWKLCYTLMGIACFPCPQQGRARSVLGTEVFFTMIILWIASSWSQESVQAGLRQNYMFPVMGTHPHNALCCTSSKVFCPFKHTYKLQNISPYSTPCHIGQRSKVNRNYSGKHRICQFASLRVMPPLCSERGTRDLFAPKQMAQVLHRSCGLSCSKNETFGYLMESTFLHLMLSSVFLVLHKGCSNVI